MLKQGGCLCWSLWKGLWQNIILYLWWCRLNNASTQVANVRLKFCICLLSFMFTICKWCNHDFFCFHGRLTWAFYWTYTCCLGLPLFFHWWKHSIPSKVYWEEGHLYLRPHSNGERMPRSIVQFVLWPCICLQRQWILALLWAITWWPWVDPHEVGH